MCKIQSVTVMRCIFAVIALAPLRAQLVQEMTAERIEEAIRDGGDEDYRVGPRFGGSSFTTPFSRVVAAAKAAKSAFRPFSIKDVTAEMIAREIVVTVPPLEVRETFSGRVNVNGVKAVVILPVGINDPGKAVQPLRVSKNQIKLPNPRPSPLAQPGTDAIDVEEFVAVFSLAALSEDHELVIVGELGRPVRNRFRLGGVR